MGESQVIDLFGGRPVYLFACNENSEQLARIIQVDGFIDDFREGCVFTGLPVVNGESISSNAVLINCTLASKGRLARSRIESLPCSTTYDYADVLAAHPDVIPAPLFVEQTVADLADHDAEWQQLRDRLNDEASRKTLDDLIEFRTTARLDALADYNFAPEQQYFDHVMAFSDDEVFVDCGGFDGDTTEEFVKRSSQYKRIYLFEPSPANLAKAQTRLERHAGIEYIPHGVSDRPGVESFDASSGSASAISDSGHDRISLTTIDEAVPEPVTFIKMDLEGWELKALEGAREHIKRDHPKLAIAVYHHPADFWRVPSLVLGIRNDYDIYLRHYTEGWTETVMYFVPA